MDGDKVLSRSGRRGMGEQGEWRGAVVGKRNEEVGKEPAERGKSWRGGGAS